MLLTSHPLIPSTAHITRNQQSQEDKLWDHISYSSSRRTTQGYVYLQDALSRRGSLADVVELASREHTCHDTIKCYNCDIVAMYYLLGIEWVLKQAETSRIQGVEDTISCTTDLLELIWQMCQMVLAHSNAPFPAGDWYVAMTKQLWLLAKQLKEETSGSDCCVVNSLTPSTFNNSNNTYFQQQHHHGHYQHNITTNVTSLSSPPPSPMVFEDKEMEMCDEQEAYRRAIRITIYNCRALVSQNNSEIDKAIVYFRKCVAVRPPPTLKTQKSLRQTAIVALDRLLAQQNSNNSTKSSRSSSISSISGGSASSSSMCGNCGVEKRTMPVCAICRAKFYCSSRCLVAHKAKHQKECKGRVGIRNPN
ncbi:hypothetical protein INT45_000426 [Circinella minor]|uniref:MYND-type domain-containing protein n=1 Tax=Circinella minor TaxID=1195481 RepID=A0A8H7RYG7_9FUNG|nr:hypothetical protein INT45_000426 [Circinella minor]